MVIAAAAIGKSAFAIPIEIVPSTVVDDGASLIVPQRRGQATGDRQGAAILRRRALCHLGVAPRGCFNWVAPRAAAAAAMLTEWVRMGGLPTGRRRPTRQGNHAPL